MIFWYNFMVGARIVPKNCPIDRNEKTSLLSCTISWQRGGSVKLGSAAGAPSLTARLRRLAWQHGCTARHHQGMAAPATTNTVLPPRAATVVMKTPVATAMAGAQKSTINLKHRNGNDGSDEDNN